MELDAVYNYRVVSQPVNHICKLKEESLKIQLEENLVIVDCIYNNPDIKPPSYENQPPNLGVDPTYTMETLELISVDVS